MKHLSFIFSFVLVLVMMAGTAQARITGSFAQVGTIDQPEADFLDDLPAGFTAWHMLATVEDTTADGKPNGFIAAEFLINLTNGSIFYAEFAPGVQVNGSHLTPGVGANSRSTFEFSLSKSARFDTHVSAPGHFANPFLGTETTTITDPFTGEETVIPGLPAFPDDGSLVPPGFVSRRRPLTTPTSFGTPINVGVSVQAFNMGFFDIPDTNPDSGLFNPFYTDGTYVIGMVTLSDDAVGRISLRLYDAENAGTTPPTQSFDIVDGEIPEPSSVVLALLGLVGLGMTRLRRRCRA